MNNEKQMVPVDPFSEYAMLCEDDDYPKTDFTQFQFRGKIDHGAMAKAYEEAVLEVPIFHSHMIHGKNGIFFQPYWVPNFEQKNRLIIEDCRHMAKKPFDPMAFSTQFYEMHTRRRIDLAREFPFQGYLIQFEDDGYIFSVRYHHSCLDPAKFFVVFNKMLSRYHEMVKGQLPEWANYDGMKGLARSDKVIQSIPLSKYMYYQFEDIYFKYPKKKVAHIFSEKILDYHQEKGRHSLRAVIDDPKLLEGITSRVKRHHATVNDLLMACGRKVITHWNREHDVPHEAVRLMLVSSLKGRRDKKIMESGAAIGALGFVSDGHGDLPLDSLIEIFRDKRIEMLNNGYDIQLNYLINKFISAYRIFPYPMRRKISLSMVQNTPITFYVSNVGIMWPKFENGRPTMGSVVVKVGDFVIEDIHSSASITQFMGMGLTTRTHNNRFYMNFVCDRYRFREHEAIEIRDRIVSEFINAIS